MIDRILEIVKGIFTSNHKGIQEKITAEDNSEAIERGINRIKDNKLMENLANLALRQLKEDEDYTTLYGVECQFGYLFEFDNHGIEALFKITTDKGIFYFAVQGDRLLLLDLTEDLFIETTDVFLRLHREK